VRSTGTGRGAANGAADAPPVESDWVRFAQPYRRAFAEPDVIRVVVPVLSAIAAQPGRKRRRRDDASARPRGGGR
jgi:hypothetical protein